ncbi:MULTISPECIES: thiamine pyrophosphate-dependent enzyme [Chitinophagaceae]
MAKKVADQLVETLVEAGIKRIYAVTGDSLNYVNDAVRRNGQIRWVHVRHEEAGAYAAAAEAELNGMACCAGSSGPGHVHLINGLYDANRANAPVLAIASTCESSEFGMDYFQETNTIKLFDDCSVYNQIATTTAQFPRMLQTALQHAYFKGGVSVLGLPGDLAQSDAEESITAPYLLPSESVFRPADEDLKKLAYLLNEHSKITIYCGIGCKGAHDEIIQLAALLKAPIAYSFRGKFAIDYDNPWSIGMTGLLGIPSAYHAMHESEVILLLGTDFPYANFMPVNCKIVQVDLRPERIGRRAKVELGLAGKIKDTIAALLPLVKNKEDNSFLQEQVDNYQKATDNLNIYVRDRGAENAIAPEFVTATINTLAKEDAIFTVDTGMCCVWGARYLHGTGKREMLGSFNHGSMANAMPMAIGAAFARPHQQVVALCGDGGISMLLGDLMTVAQYKLSIKLIVFDNRSLGMVKAEMQVAGLPDWQTDMDNPDFAKVAEAMGITAFTLKDPDQVVSTLQEAFTTDGPVLVHVYTNPNALAMPPKIEWSQMAGYAQSMTKLMMSGKMDEVLDIVKSNFKHIKEIL